MDSSRAHETDVAIVGGGPVGLLLALELGKSGKTVTLIERWPETYDRPRAVTMDHEVARILATYGIDCNNDPMIDYHEELYYWKNADLKDLQIVDWKSISSSGWRVTYWFNQPEFEERLFGFVTAMPNIRILRGWEATNLTQTENEVTLEAQNRADKSRSESTKTIKAAFAVGADGANSFVRESLEISTIDKGYFFDWLILDMIPKGEYKVSPAQWQLCDPKRPTTIVPGGPGRRRWEFMVLPDESAEDIAKEESAWALLKPWGLTPQNAELERSAVYRFQARWAETWRKGRVLIAGDAAHLMPPFAGEGMCAGLRDALSLGWRLNGILDGLFGDDILDSYVSERIHHAKHYIDFSQELGKIICISDPKEAAARDTQMIADLAARNHEPIHGDNCELGSGIWCENTKDAGRLSTQGIVEMNGQTGLFDQCVGQGWFVLAINKDTEDLLSEGHQKAFASIGGKVLKIGTPETECDVIDRDATYANWMKEIDANYVILRPDFYTAATAKTPEDLRTCLTQLLSKLRLNSPVTTG